ncbi:hypothetical protein NP493_1971g00019 [Ridgeia piscesae]|uniref:Caspase family p20 domain-containing protein n=1 Tax=Ridgeia piscesae TaxID=27915 RepID=A0AAD9JPC2_RIDPI|nr:hypothetical protein NP493_1971g00019 [Ridgeia piscesae]
MGSCHLEFWSSLQIPRYNVTKERIELVMIVNEKFTDNFSNRPWATEDAARLKAYFGSCQKPKSNLNASQMRETFKHVPTDIDCLVVFVSSYGQPGRVLGADGGSQLTVAEMLDVVNENEALAGKPCVFILQTCDISSMIAQADGGNNNKDTWTIPSTADNLVVQSLYPGENGLDKHPGHSSFITALCCEMEDNVDKSKDIRHIMTRVIARMKDEIEEEHIRETWPSLMKLLPIQVSMLTKQLFL